MNKSALKQLQSKKSRSDLKVGDKVMLIKYTGWRDEQVIEMFGMAIIEAETATMWKCAGERFLKCNCRRHGGTYEAADEIVPWTDDIIERIDQFNRCAAKQKEIIKLYHRVEPEVLEEIVQILKKNLLPKQPEDYD